MTTNSNVVAGRGTYFMYDTQTTTDSFVEILFEDGGNNFYSNNIRIINSGPNDLEFSFDGTTIHGAVLSTEDFEFKSHRAKSIWVKSQSAGQATNMRMFVW